MTSAPSTTDGESRSTTRSLFSFPFLSHIPFPLLPDLETSKGGVERIVTVNYQFETATGLVGTWSSHPRRTSPRTYVTDLCLPALGVVGGLGGADPSPT